MGDRLLLVGCGKMGGAMLSGWIERGADPGDITVIEPHAESAAAAREAHGVRVLESPSDLPGDPPVVIVFAVKPQTLPEMAAAYAPIAGGGAVALSIAAGRPIGFFEAALGAETAVVRSMPNTPAAVGRGIAAACANPNVSHDQRALCQRLLTAIGEVVWVEDESLIDAVTAVSGSGPAYVFLLIECMTEAGIAEGLPPDIAARLARATVAGSGELARLSDEDAAQLRVNVTSPGGTTEAALAVLMADDGMAALMKRAIAAAARRSRELA